MAQQDFLLRTSRPTSLVAFNDALPANFKLLHNPEGEWIALPGVHITTITNLELVPGTLSSDIFYNIRLLGDLPPGNEIYEWHGWDGLFIQPGDPDYDDGTGTGDPQLDNNKLKRWLKTNGNTFNDPANAHPRSGRTMLWYRWRQGPERVDFTIDEPVFRRQIWAGD